MSLEKCSIGFFVNEECHKLSYTSYTGLVLNEELSQDDLELLSRRIHMDVGNIETVCFHHKKQFLEHYTHLNRACCDPFGIHKKSVVYKPMKIISLDMAKQSTKVALVPGKSICNKCVLRLRTNSEDISIITESNMSDFVHIVEKESEINHICASMSVAPLKRCSKDSEEKRVTKIQRKCETLFETIHWKLKRAAGTEVDKTYEVLQKDHDIFLERLKSRLSKCASSEEQMQILTLMPDSWTTEQILGFTKEFNITAYTVRRARRLLQVEGILPSIENRAGRKIQEEVENSVREYYERQDISRECPGMKDCKSVRNPDGTRVLRQKRLLLDNLKDIHNTFQEEHPGIKIGFSTFAALRPPWCVLAGSSGTHTVCVCTKHQNLKLMIAILDPHLKTKDLLQMIVCSVENEQCMLGKCPDCPKIFDLNELLGSNLSDNEEVSYKQWVTGQPYKLVAMTSSSFEFSELFTKSILELRQHHYIAKSQSKFLASLKSSLTKGHCIVLCDFAENYSFIVQDAVQSYHWDNTQATLHPFVVYLTNDEGNMITESLCVISDSLEHTTITVHTFQKEVLRYLKERHGFLVRVFYFSDGAASQYKNKNNFCNLLHHKYDFGLTAEWHFFATSHGKSPCDGVGGTIKRMARRASLQRTLTDQIQTPLQLNQFAEKNISGIKTIYVAAAQVEESRRLLDNRFRNLKTLKNTRAIHSIVPVGGNTLRTRITSDSTVYTDVMFQ